VPEVIAIAGERSEELRQDRSGHHPIGRIVEAAADPSLASVIGEME
jgi:hypothetical protein